MKALFVVPSDYDALAQKGVLHMIAERDEDGYLKEVVTVHPFAPKAQVNFVAENNVVYDFRQPLNVRPRIWAWVRFAIHLLMTVVRVRLLVFRRGIDIVRAQDPYFAGLIGWLAARIPPRRRFCISIHSDYDKRYALDGPKGAPVIFGSRLLAKKLERFLLRHADFILPHFTSRGANAVKDGADPSRVKLFRPGIDMTPFERDDNVDILSTLGLSEEHIVLSFAGRFSQENYIYDYLDIARAFLDGRADRTLIRFVMAGGGEEETEFRRRLQDEPELSANFILPGYLDRRQVVALRKASYASLCLMGGFSLIEACAAACPVVAYAVEWHDELVRNGETGVLAPDGDIGPVVAGLSDLFANPDKAKALGERARTLAYELYDRRSTKVQHRAIYEALYAGDWDIQVG